MFHEGKDQTNIKDKSKPAYDPPLITFGLKPTVGLGKHDTTYSKYKKLFSDLNMEVLPGPDDFTDQDAKRIKAWLSTPYGRIFESWATGTKPSLSKSEYDTIERDLWLIKSGKAPPSIPALDILPLQKPSLLEWPLPLRLKTILPERALDTSSLQAYFQPDDGFPTRYFDIPLKPSQTQKRSAPAKKSLPKMPPSFAELDKMIGLEPVKQEIRTKIATARVQQERAKRGLATGADTLHMIFTGNPGTGKTAVARIVGKIYREAGLLSEGHLVEMDRGVLTGMYQGDIERNTKEKLKEARGGVFFLDEAYDLAPRKDGHFDIGKLAITIILKEMYDQRGSFALIAAGYADKMSDFLDSNPGLRSRCPTIIEFPDYTPDELIAIFKKMASDAEYKLVPKAEKKLEDLVKAMYAKRGKHFGNAREIESMFDKCRSRLSLRISDIDYPSREDLMNIFPEDFPDPDELK